MSEFEPTDFVQVRHPLRLESGEPYHYWRNALYVGFILERHHVIYTDGTCEVLNSHQQIRKVETK